MNKRRAVSLLELLVVMSAVSTLLTTCAVFLHRAMRDHSKAQAFLATQRSSLRLSSQFREDVHRAVSARTTDLPDSVVLQLKRSDAETVEYHRSAAALSRLLLVKDRVEWREQFEFPPNIEVAVGESEAPRRVSLSITTRAITAGGPDDSSPLPLFVIPVHFQAEACLGRDLVVATAKTLPATREAQP